MSRVNEWPKVKLSELLSQNKEKVWVEDPGAVKLVSVRLHGQGAVQRRLSKEKLPGPFTGFRGRSGQIIYSRIWARKGAIALIPPELDNVVVTNEFPIFDFNEEKLNPRFFIHLSQSPAFLANLELAASGSSGQNRVKEDRFLDIEILLPPLDEQQRISKVLDLTAVTIDHCENQLTLLSNLVLSYTSKFLDQEQTSPLSSFGSFSGGMTPNKKNSTYWGGTVRWFSTKDLKQPVLTDSIDHVTDQALAGTSLKLITPLSIAFSLRGMSLAHRVPMSRIPAESAINQDLKAFVPHDPDGIRVLYALIKTKTPWLLSKVSTSSHGTKKLDFTHLQNLELPTLSAKDFYQLDQVLAQIEELEQKKTKKLETLQSLHHSLSTRAFAGQL